MIHVTCTNLRANRAGFMDEVCDNRTPLVIIRQNAPNVVMLAEDDYGGLMETIHLLRNPVNAVRLLQSNAEADKEPSASAE